MHILILGVRTKILELDKVLFYRKSFKIKNKKALNYYIISNRKFYRKIFDIH